MIVISKVSSSNCEFGELNGGGGGFQGCGGDCPDQGWLRGLAAEERKADSRWKNGREFTQREAETKTQFLGTKCFSGGVGWILGTVRDAESKGVTFFEGPPEIPDVRCKPEMTLSTPL